MRMNWFSTRLVLGLVVSLALALAAVVQVPCAQAQSPSYVHFVVIEPTPAEGADLDVAMNGFKKELLALAGGYTIIGQTLGGSLQPDGTVHQGANLSLLVAAQHDLTKELEALVPKYFKEDKPFVLVWQGSVNR